MLNCLITRNASVDDHFPMEVPAGHKLVVVFGVLTVPEDAVVNGNHTIDVSPDSVLGAESKPLPDKYAVWEAPDVCRDLFGIASMREHSVVTELDRALSLVRDRKFRDPELQDLAEKLKGYLEALPSSDTIGIGTVMKAIVSIAEQNKPQLKE